MKFQLKYVSAFESDPELESTFEGRFESLSQSEMNVLEGSVESINIDED